LGGFFSWIDLSRLTVIFFQGRIMSFHDLFVFRVWVEKTAVILMSLPLYVTCLFFCSFQHSFFVLCAECFDYGVSGGVSFLDRTVWWSVTSCSRVTLSFSS
jgi:hypothetical protein